MKKKIFLLCIAVLCFSTAAFSQPAAKEMNIQDAIYKAIQLDTAITNKKTALEKEKAATFKKFEDEFASESDKLKKEQKGEFETTKEFNSRIDARRIELASTLQKKKDDYIQNVYNVAKNRDIVNLEKELDDLIAQSYKLPDSYYKITIDKYNADGSYYPVAVSYYVRTDVDKASGKKNFVWDKAPLRWEIEMDKAKGLSPRKDKLVLNCRATIFKVNGNYLFDKYEVSIADPDTKDVLFSTLFWQNKKLAEQPAVRIPTGGFPVVSVACSSLLTEKRDRNMYQPVKVFDGKPDTGWAENAPGSGLGNAIEITFAKPVTADKLLVSPGWFDQRYWIIDNRLRVLAIELDDVRLEGNFKDQMVPQEVDLHGAKTFTRARFIIRDVYRTAKDDDSCISEIEFRLGNRKVDLDLSPSPTS